MAKKDGVQKETKKEVKLVKMVNGDLKADVHPDEVKNYEAVGFQKVN